MLLDLAQKLAISCFDRVGEPQRPLLRQSIQGKRLRFVSEDGDILSQAELLLPRVGDQPPVCVNDANTHTEGDRERGIGDKALRNAPPFAKGRMSSAAAVDLSPPRRAHLKAQFAEMSRLVRRVLESPVLPGDDPAAMSSEREPLAAALYELMTIDVNRTKHTAIQAAVARANQWLKAVQQETKSRQSGDWRRSGDD
jgi:hypothetical protein